MENPHVNSLENRFVHQLGEDDILQNFIRPIAHSIDDDVAELELPPGQRLVVSTDALLEGVHFLRESSPEWVGQKAVRATLSDLAASGAEPLWVMLSLSMPGSLPVLWLKAFCQGFGEALKTYGVVLAGGDLTASREGIAISVTVMGGREPWEKLGRQAPLTRSGARLGQAIYVSGYLGQTLPGLDSLLRRRQLSPQQQEIWEARHFLTPNRVALGRALYQQNLATGLMDLSDGLALDLPKLLKASKVGATVWLENVPVSKEFLALGYTAKDALSAGEDFELLFTIDPERESDMAHLASRLDLQCMKIGTIQQGCEMKVLDASGQELELKKSWQHF